MWIRWSTLIIWIKITPRSWDEYIVIIMPDIKIVHDEQWPKVKYADIYYNWFKPRRNS